MQAGVETNIENQLGVIKLSREKALNSLTLAMIQKMHANLHHWSQREDIAFILFPSLQQKVYCAGGDIRWLYEQGKAGCHDRQMTFFADEYRLDYAVGQFEKPIIAVVDGFLIGGGMGLILPAQTVFATESARFAMPETSIGFFPDVGMCRRLSHCPGYTGLYLTLTGQRINAYDAFLLGLVDGVLKDDDAIRIQEIARQTEDDSNLHQTVLDAFKAEVSRHGQTPVADNQTQIDEVFSAESVEAIIASLKHKSGDWAEQTLKQLEAACPLSLRVTFDLMHRAANFDPGQAYQIDYTVAHHFMRSADFYEGVRAQVIDKDRNPSWQYKHVSDISQSEVEQFFTCPGNPLDLTYSASDLKSERVIEQ